MRSFATRRSSPTTWLASGLASLLLGPVAAQTTSEPELPDIGPPAPVPAEAPPGTADIDRHDLRRHVYWLADDARGGRYTGSAGQQATAEYVAAQFQTLGLEPLGDRGTYLQHYPLERLELDASTGLVYGDEKVTDGFAVLHASEKDKLSLRGRFVACGNGAPEQVPDKLKGRIPLVVLDGAAGDGGTGGDLRAVQRYVAISKVLDRAGASGGVVCLLDDGGSLANTLNYRGLLADHAQLAFDQPKRPLVHVPLLVLSAARSRPLLQHVGLMDTDGRLVPDADIDKQSGRLTIRVKQVKKATASNVVAVLEGGGRKSEAIVFSAHHDHVGTRLDGDCFNGADDNASGTATLLEIAQAFAAAGERPERSIVFLSVSGEELGLWGSAWFAEHPTWPLSRIVADVNIDMVGRAGSRDGKILMQVTPSHGHDEYSTLVRDGVALGERFGIAFTSGDQYYQRSDHFNFAKNGVPVVFFCDGEHPDYHRVTDSADRLDYAAMEAIARLAYWTGRRAADAKGRPDRLGKQPGW